MIRDVYPFLLEWPLSELFHIRIADPRSTRGCSVSPWHYRRWRLCLLTGFRPQRDWRNLGERWSSARLVYSQQRSCRLKKKKGSKSDRVLSLLVEAHGNQYLCCDIGYFSKEYLVTRRVPYRWKRGCFTTFLGIFSTRGENIIFRWRGARKMRLNIKINIEMNIPAGGAWARWWGLGSGNQGGGRGGGWGPLSGIPYPQTGILSPSIWYAIFPV